MPVNLLAIGVGDAPGDGNGDGGRTAFQKVNYNFALAAGALEDAEIKSILAAICGTKTNVAVEDNAKSFRMAYSFVLLEVRADVDDAPTGDDIVLDINVNGTTILNSGGLVIDAGEEMSSVSPLPTDVLMIDRDKVSIDVLQVGSTTPGKGLTVTFIGYVVLTSY